MHLYCGTLKICVSCPFRLFSLRWWYHEIVERSCRYNLAWRCASILLVLVSQSFRQHTNSIRSNCDTERVDRSGRRRPHCTPEQRCDRGDRHGRVLRPWNAPRYTTVSMIDPLLYKEQHKTRNTANDSRTVSDMWAFWIGALFLVGTKRNDLYWSQHLQRWSKLNG